MLTWLARHLPLTLLLLGVLALVLLGLLVWVLLRALRRSREEEEAAEAAEVVTVDLSRSWRLRSAFVLGLARLRRLVFGRDYRYQIPWFLLLGQSGSRPAELLANAGLSLPQGAPDEAEMASSRGCAWWLCDRGVVLDLAGEHVLRADGRSWSEGGWRTFLRLLQRTRPQRPADGVILTLSCADLLAAPRDPDALADLERRAGLLAERLMEAQRELGLRLPVWVLVTGCEELGGFDRLVRALPPEQRDGIFGWSSPYRTDASFRPGWIDEAFANLGAGLRRAQLGIYAGLPGGATADAVFAFPDELEELRRPLASALARLFQTSAYQEAPFLRGLYLCGADPADPASAGVWGPRTRFLRDLFEQKIFPEAALAAPAAQTLVARNRKVRLAQALLAAGVLLLSLGTTLGYLRLAGRQPELGTFLQRMADNVEAVRRAGGSETAADPGRAFELLDLMARTDLTWFGSPFLPTSWVSPFNRRAQGAITTQFDTVVLPAMQMGLTRRAEELAGGLPPGCAALAEEAAAGSGDDTDEAPRPVSVDRTPELLELRCYLRELSTLRHHALLYNELPASEGLDELRQVVRYVSGEDLPPGFLLNSTLYRRALRQVYGAHPFTLAGFRPGATRTTQILVTRLYHRLFAESPLRSALGELAGELETAALEPLEGGDDPAARLEGLRTALARARIAGRPELAWAFAAGFDLGPAFDQILTNMRALEGGERPELEMLEPLQGAVLARGEERWRELQEDLLEARSIQLDELPLLERSAGPPVRPLPRLAPVLRVLAEELEGWARGFPSPRETRDFTEVIPAGMRLLWDPAPLVETEPLLAAYDSFRQQGLELFPAELRETVDQAARQRLGVRLSYLVARAQRRFRPALTAGAAFLRADDLEAEVTALAAAAPRLHETLGAFERLWLDDRRRGLATLLASQGHRLLVEADRLLEESGLYLPGDESFAAWTGTGPAGPAVLAAYGVSDEAELGSYLGAQHRQLAQLADRFVRPVIRALPAPPPGPSPPVRERWEGILAELAAYEAQTPGNSVAKLESYISATLPQARLDDCPPGEPAAGGDFFNRRQERLRRGLGSRCRERAAAGYAEMVRFFNARLKGHFPFAATTTGDLVPAADPEDLRAFYRLFDRWAEGVRALLQDRPAFGDSGPEVLRFLGRMEALRGVLAPYLEADEPGLLPALDFEVEFRVHRDQEPGGERGGNQIIEWTLAVGDQVIDDRDPEPRGRWVRGDRVRLALRWAKDGPRVPASDLAPLGVVVRDRTVIFEHTDPWSLFSLLRARSASREDFTAFTDPRPHTLKLEVATRPAGAEEPVEHVRVFLRLGLVDPESKSPLRLPLTLPRTAPQVPAQVLSALHIE